MITRSQLAKHLDLSTRSIQRLQEEEIISRGDNGYDLDECRVNYIRYLRKKGSYTLKDGTGDITAEKARLTKAQADEREISVKKMMGELIAADEVQTTWSDYVANARAKLLALPSKSAQQLLSLESYQEVETYLKEMVYEALEELAIDEADTDGEGDTASQQDLETTTST